METNLWMKIISFHLVTGNDTRKELGQVESMPVCQNNPASPSPSPEMVGGRREGGEEEVQGGGAEVEGKEV